jgi:hypothetical protein
MSNLLAPSDEREFTAFLCDVVGAKLLLSDLTTDGEPQLATDPVAAVPPVPGPAYFGSPSVYYLNFWLPSAGPIRTLADAPTPTTPHDIVARRLTADAAGDRMRNLIDFDRTPAFVLRRTTAKSPQRLAPGGYASKPLRDPQTRSVPLTAKRTAGSEGVLCEPIPLITVPRQCTADQRISARWCAGCNQRHGVWSNLESRFGHGVASVGARDESRVLDGSLRRAILREELASIEGRECDTAIVAESSNFFRANFQ